MRHAPAVLGAAEALLARTRSHATEAKSLALDDRLARLEQGSRDSAQLIEQMAQQIHALTLAQRAFARRAQFGLVGAALAGLVALAALLLALAS